MQFCNTQAGMLTFGMQKSQMKWDDLRVFLQVARDSRLLVAGRTLGLDPATVGRRITALEDALGAKLFDRSPQGYAITEAGRNLVAHAQGMENLAAAAREDVGGHAEKLTGTVRVGAPDGVANFLLPEATKAMHQENPGLQVQIVALPRLFSLSRREADLAIAVSPPTAGRLKIRKIGQYRLRMYGHRDLVANLGDPQTRAEIQNVPKIGYIQDMIFDKELDYLASMGEVGGADLSSNSLIVQLRWTRLQCGLCILPDFVAVHFPDLVPVLTQKVNLKRNFYLLRHQDDERVARVNAAAECISVNMRSRLSELSKLP